MAITSSSDKSDKTKLTRDKTPSQKDLVVESGLRPTDLSEYVGQKQLKQNLKYLIESGRLRNQPLDHILLYGAPGLGKTTLANIIAKETGANLRITSGPALEKQGDIAALITNLKQNDILFIDEVHRMRAPVEEILYSAMEDFAIDLVVGKGPAAKSMRLKLPHFTLIGATTKVSMVSSPLRDRFGFVYKLKFYNNEELGEIVDRSAKRMKLLLTEDAKQLIAKSSRQTPRIANRILKRVRDFAVVSEFTEVDEDCVKKCFQMFGIDNLGLDDADRNLLRILMNRFNGGPVGLSSLAAATNDDEATIEDVIEPYLLQLGFIERTARGRVITGQAVKHIEIFN